MITGSIIDLGMSTLLQGQGHACGQRARWYRWPSILLIRFLFISHQSEQQFLRYSYFEIWPWNIQDQGHGLGKRSRSHIITDIKQMHFPFVSHQSDQPFLRYGQNSVWTLKKLSYFIVQTINFLLIDATAVTLGQSHEMVTQYISLPETYISFVPNIWGIFAHTFWCERQKSLRRRKRRKRTEKHKVTPDRGD